MPERSSPGKKPGNPLKPICVVGLVLALVLSWALVFFALIWGNGGEGTKIAGTDGFDRELQNYDLFDTPKLVLEGENPELIERRLSRLQKQAAGVEEHLSVLKRRRTLALIDRRYIPAYVNAAREAAEAFPYSAPIAAVAVDSLVFDDSPLSKEACAGLEVYAARVSQSRFGLLELSARILAGGFRDPARALEVPGLENLFSPVLSLFPGETPELLAGKPLPEEVRQALLVDEFLLRVLHGDISGALVRLNNLLAAEPEDPGLMRMGAEFFYDNDHPLRAARLFSRLAEREPFFAAPGGFAQGGASAGQDIARAADALVLAGDIPGARNIWLALSAGADSYQSRRGFYNLAASSADSKEEASWLLKIFSLQSSQSSEVQNSPDYETDGLGVYSIIRYTRLLDVSRSIDILADDKMRRYPLLDLELLRRRLESWPPTRSAAEVWLLLERGGGEEALYEWAAWYFDHQKLYDETRRLLTEAGRKEMTGHWFDLHGALALIREGKTAEGERLLSGAKGRGEDWRISANLGRIEESRRALSAALRHYEAAAVLVTEKKQAALIQMRLSRCLEALGRTGESREALEAAQELDPDNLNIRRELRRF